jgi:hypothetical protein
MVSMLYVTIPALPLFLVSAGGAGALGIAIAMLTTSAQNKTLAGGGLKKVAVLLLTCTLLIVSAVTTTLFTYGPAGVYR